MALGTEKTYYDAAWTNNYSKFTTKKPSVEETKEDNEEIIKDPEKEDTTNNNDKETKRENPMLWLLDKIIKFIIKIFKRRNS